LRNIVINVLKQLKIVRQSMPIKFAWSHQCQLEITSVVALVERIL
jgi:hypothetical protein